MTDGMKLIITVTLCLCAFIATVSVLSDNSVRSTYDDCVRRATADRMFEDIKYCADIIDLTDCSHE